MNILIDMRPLLYASRYRGIGAHIINLTRALLNISGDYEIYLLFPRKDLHILEEIFENKTGLAEIITDYPVKMHELPYYFVDHKYINTLCSRYAIDVFFCTTFAEMPIPHTRLKVPIITWVYDLIFFDYFAFFGYTPKNIVKLLLWKIKLGAIQHDDALIFSSQDSRKSFLRRYPKCVEKSSIIALGVDESFYITNSNINCIEKKYDLPEKFAIFVGGLDPRKNLLSVIKAIAQVNASFDMRLVIVGNCRANDPAYDTVMKEIENYRLQDKIKFIGHVPYEDLPMLYAKSEVLIFPSVAEGFGLPVLEAMAAGCPVITSNCSSLPEVIGDCGLIVDPNSVNEIANVIYKLYTNAQLRENLVTCGQLRARQFNWCKAATEFLEICRRVARDNR